MSTETMPERTEEKTKRRLISDLSEENQLTDSGFPIWVYGATAFIAGYMLIKIQPAVFYCV